MTAGEILLYRDATNLRISASDLMRPLLELALFGNVSRRDRSTKPESYRALRS